MNIFLWALQILLALHTFMGAIWKITNSEQSVPSLSAIPHGVWTAIIVFELLCAAGLVIPGIYKKLAKLAPIAAVGIAVEMLFFCAVHINSGATEHAHMIYWLVVAVICAFTAYGRFKLKPQ